MLRALREEARQAGQRRVCSRDRRRLARVKILTVEGFMIQFNSVQSSSVPFRPSSTWLRLTHTLKATARSNPFSDPRLELCRGKDHRSSSWQLPREHQCHIASIRCINSTDNTQYIVQQRNVRSVCRIYSSSIQGTCIVAKGQCDHRLYPQPAYPLLLLAITTMNISMLAFLTYLKCLNPFSLPVPWSCDITPCCSSAVITTSQSARMALAHPLSVLASRGQFAVLTSGEKQLLESSRL